MKASRTVPSSRRIAHRCVCTYMRIRSHAHARAHAHAHAHARVNYCRNVEAMHKTIQSDIGRLNTMDSELAKV